MGLEVSVDTKKTERLLRLLEALKAAGVEHGTRNKAVAEKTGYSAKSVGNILSGSATLARRSCRIICDAFGIREEWVWDGLEPMLSHGEKISVDKLVSKLGINSDELIDRMRQLGIGISSDKHINDEKTSSGFVSSEADDEFKFSFAKEAMKVLTDRRIKTTEGDHFYNVERSRLMTSIEGNLNICSIPELKTIAQYVAKTIANRNPEDHN